jgi:hypothetical protein
MLRPRRKPKDLAAPHPFLRVAAVTAAAVNKTAPSALRCRWFISRQPAPFGPCLLLFQKRTRVGLTAFIGSRCRRQPGLPARHCYRDAILTSVTVSVTLGHRINLALKDAVRVMPGGKGECGACGWGLISSAPGRLGHHACRHYDRHPRQFGIVFREAWPELSFWDESPSGENRGGTPAGERARKRRAAQAAYSVARPAPAGAGHLTMRLPAVRFLYVPEARALSAGSGPKRACFVIASVSEAIQS